MRGDRLRKVREARGYTQEELAEHLNIGSLQIWRYENGETEPKGDVVAKIAQYLNVSTDYLLGLTDNPMGHTENDLTPKEQRVLAAMRHGDVVEAIKVIVSDE